MIDDPNPGFHIENEPSPIPDADVEAVPMEEVERDTTDTDRAASAAPGGDIDEAGEDEMVDGGMVDRAIGAEMDTGLAGTEGAMSGEAPPFRDQDFGEPEVRSSVDGEVDAEAVHEFESEDFGIPDDAQPESQGDEPFHAEIGDEGQGDLAPEDEP